MVVPAAWPSVTAGPNSDHGEDPAAGAQTRRSIMSQAIPRNSAAHIVGPDDVEVFDVMGARVEYLTAPEGDLPCLMRGTIPPGVSVPMHRHADPETFVAVSGEVEGLSHSGESFAWLPIRPGDIFHVPSGVKHGFRNRSRQPSVMLITSTSQIGRFFQEVGVRLGDGSPSSAPPTPEAIQHFMETSERYGYWNASPEENAKVGIDISLAA
jgi:quercetin dioxygenase-like cupin family protein